MQRERPELRPPWRPNRFIRVDRRIADARDRRQSASPEYAATVACRKTAETGAIGARSQILRRRLLVVVNLLRFLHYDQFDLRKSHRWSMTDRLIRASRVRGRRPK